MRQLEKQLTAHRSTACCFFGPFLSLLTTRVQLTDSLPPPPGSVCQLSTNIVAIAVLQVWTLVLRLCKWALCHLVSPAGRNKWSVCGLQTGSYVSVILGRVLHAPTCSAQNTLCSSSSSLHESLTGVCSRTEKCSWYQISRVLFIPASANSQSARALSSVILT